MPHKHSETGFLIGTLWRIIKLPFILLLVILNKKKPKELLSPITFFFHYILEAKLTLILILSNIIIFFFLPTQPNWIFHPLDLLQGNFTSLFTSLFLHANLIHLGNNMIGLFIFGRIVEHKLGFFKTLLVYLTAGIIANLTHMLIHLTLNSNIGAIGASGALMGLVSMGILLNPFTITYEFVTPLPVIVVGWTLFAMDIIGLLSPTQTGIAHFAHLGGFLSVFASLSFLSIRQEALLRKGFIINGITFILGLGISLFLIFL